MAADHKPLKLIKGGSPDDPAEGRTHTARRRTGARRTVTRRRPPGSDPVTEVLERLDEEPAEAGTPLARAKASASAEPRIPSQRRRTVQRSRRPIEPPKARRRWAGKPSRTTAALLLVFCAALAAAGYFGAGWYGDRLTQQANQQAIAAAKQACVDFVSVSAASVDRDLQRILAGTTGDFRDEFSRGQSQVRAAVVENNVQSQGTVLRAALLSGDRRRATVLVAIDATVRNTNAPEGRQSHYRIQVELSRQKDKWLVSRLQFVG
jgi:Mce-associated membrane protein